MKATSDKVQGQLIKKTRSNVGKLMPEKQYVGRRVVIDFQAKTVSIARNTAKKSSKNKSEFK